MKARYVEADAPMSAVAWVAWAVTTAACAGYAFFDPLAVLLLLLATVHSAVCLLGTAALLPAPGPALLVWAAVVLPHSLHGLVLALHAFVRTEAGEIDALAQLTPPLLRSCACSLLLLLPGLGFPLRYLYHLLLLLIGSVLLVLVEGLLILPLAHVLLRPRVRVSSANGNASTVQGLKKKPQTTPSYNTV